MIFLKRTVVLLAFLTLLAYCLPPGAITVLRERSLKPVIHCPIPWISGADLQGYPCYPGNESEKIPLPRFMIQDTLAVFRQYSPLSINSPAVYFIKN
jgi:hypothetical protein